MQSKAGRAYPQVNAMPACADTYMEPRSWRHAACHCHYLVWFFKPLYRLAQIAVAAVLSQLVWQLAGDDTGQMTLDHGPNCSTAPAV